MVLKLLKLRQCLLPNEMQYFKSLFIESGLKIKDSFNFAFMQRRLSTILTTILGLLGFLHAQEVPHTLNFSKDDYHAQSQNWSITQSPDDEMFMGNGAGVLEFDGAFWRTLSLPNQQIVRSVASDKEGRIFSGGFAEFGFWQRDDTGNYRYHSLSQGVTNSKVQKEEIWHILIFQNCVYFQSFSVIYKYDYHKITVLNPPSNIMFLHPIGNHLIMQGLTKGLYELGENNTFKFIEGSAFLANTVVSTILPLKKGFLIGTTKDGIFKYENNTFSTWLESAQSISKDFQLNKGVLLSNGNYALGTILNGIFILDTEGVLVYHINKENGLQNNTVLSFHEDHAKNLWIGLDKGIDLIDLTTPLTFFQDKSGKIGTVYAATYFNDKLYVGTNQGVFYKNKDGGNFKILNGLQGQVWDLKIFDNQLLCGHNSGTFIIKKDNTISKISEETGGWCLIRHPSKRDVLAQGLYTGVALYQKNKNEQWVFNKKIAGFAEPTKKIAFDENGDLWAITAYHQLFKIKLSENVENTEGVEQKQLPLLSKPFFDFIDNKLIFSSNKNYYYYDKNTENFAEINQDITFSKKGKLMQGIGNDLLKIEIDNIEIYSDGVSFLSKNPQNKPIKPDFQFKLKLIPDYETVIALDSSHYLFGLDDGYAVFDKNKANVRSTYKPKPIIRLYAKDGESFHFYSTDKSNSILKLPPQYRELRVNFALPHFNNATNFQYLLSNHLQKWSDWDNSTAREFVNLSAGVHQFYLKNDVSDSEESIEFEILPFWYETLWAKFLYATLIICLIFWLQKYHTFQLEKQRLKLEAEKEKELEQQRIKIDNEKLHTEVIAKSKELVNSTLNIIQKNDVLLEIKEELNSMKTGLPEKHYNRLSHLIDYNLTHEESSRIFEDNFNEVHEAFLKSIKSQFPDLTPSDLKLAALLRMNLSSKEISPLLFISVRSIENKRSRLRKKLGLSESDNLTSFLMQY